MRVEASQYEGADAIAVESATTRLVVLPSTGAKVVSLADRATGRELLSRHPERPLRPPAYGDRYERYDIGGWDECFPSIGACAYPQEPWRGAWVPDHGELWTLPWSWSALPDGVATWADGVRFPYRFTRTLRLVEGVVRVEYEVRNHAPFPFGCLWSMHPMLALTPATRVFLPAGARVRVEYSKGGRLGAYLAEHPWPRTRDRGGREVDLGLVGPPDQGFADKLYTDRVAHGAAALYDEAGGDWLAFRFDPAAVPFVGLALHRGGWPDVGPPSFDGALEPCNGWPDRLDVALARGAAVSVPPRGTLTWSVQLGHGRGWQALDTFAICKDLA